MRRALVAVLALALLMPVPTTATEARRRDPNDIHGPLDIKRISHGHRSGDVLWHKVVMRSPWGRKALRGVGEIRFQFSTDGEDRFDEVNASIDLKDGKLKVWIFPYVEGSDYASVGPSERIRFARPNRRSIKIFFGQSWVDKRDRYVWSVNSSYMKRSSRHCARGCYDYAPGASPNRIEHKL